MHYIKQVFIFLFISFYAVSFGQNSNEVLMYVGTFSGSGSKGIYICSFDTVTGDIALKNIVEGVENPNYLVKSYNGKYVYVCMRPEDKKNGTYSLGAFRVQENGGLVKINEQSAEGIDPCYVDITPDGKFVAISNYGNGTIAMYKTNADGSLNKAHQVIQHEGTGADKERQLGPHAHSIRFSPFADKVFAADLGIDKLMIYNLNHKTGKLAKGEIPFSLLPPGSGPRHFEFSPDCKFIYVVNELISSVSVIETKNYKVIQTLSTLMDDFEGVSYCADIHLSADGKFLYASNRGDNSITTFIVNNDGTIIRKATTKTTGDWPRNFTLSPKGKFMLVANQNSNDVKVFKFLKDTGIPVFISKEIKIPSPVCLKF